MKLEKAKEKLIFEVDIFLFKWCKENYPHLIDSDENDGERFRECIIRTIDLAIEEQAKQIYLGIKQKLLVNVEGGILKTIQEGGSIDINKAIKIINEEEKKWCEK